MHFFLTHRFRYKNFEGKIVNIFLPISFLFWVLKRTVSLRPFFLQEGSFEHPQHMFWFRNRKISFWYTLLTKGRSHSSSTMHQV